MTGGQVGELVGEPVGTVVGDTAAYCTRCGRPDGEGDHAGCRRALALEPPRYCPQCRRRLIVQVLPTGWTARCSAHGDLVAGWSGFAAPPEASGAVAPPGRS